MRHDKRNLVHSYYAVTSAYLAQGRYQEAQQSAQAACECAKTINDLWMLAYCLNEWGNAARAMSNYTEARHCYQESFAIKQEFNDREGMAVALNRQGELAIIQQDYEEARQLYQQSLVIYQEMGDRGFLADVYNGLGIVARALGKHQEAARCFCRALQTAQQAQLVPHALSTLTGIAELLIDVHQLEQALKLLRLTSKHPTSKEETRQKAQALLKRYQGEPGAAEESDLDTTIQEVLNDMSQLIPSLNLASERSSFLDALTGRELEILRLVANGYSNHDIARKLIFSVGTVKWYVHQIYRKLGVGSRTQAIARARELKLLA